MSVSILPDYPDMTIQLIVGATATIEVFLTSRVTIAPCPHCGTPSTRVRGTYHRNPQEVPWGTASVVIQLTVHRFRCDVPGCPQKIFCERVPWAPAYQRRTLACLQRVLSLAWEMSASAAQRVAEATGIHVHRSTINRWILKAPALAIPEPAPTDAVTSVGSPPTAPSLTVVGIDDWAWKKGQRYGTLVVDLQTHQPVDVLPDRSAATVATWLRKHPTIRVISRDRGGTYAKGAREGAPQAQQVADRFHLIKNWHDHTADLIGPWAPKPSHPPTSDPAEQSLSLAIETAGNGPVGDPVPVSPADRRRQDRWEAVHQLWDQGCSITAIAEQLHRDPKTVRKDLAAARPRRSQSPPRRPDPAETQLLGELWHGQRTTAQELWEAARQRGYAKSVASVSRWLRQRRGHVHRGRSPSPTQTSDSAMKDATPLKAKKPWTGRQWAHFLGTAWPRLPRRATHALSQRLAQDPVYRKAWTLTRHFHALIAHRRGEKTLAAWCRVAESSEIPAFVAFAQTLRHDWDAVVAGITVEWSQGPVEGLNNRTKLLKRMMYGRAALPLLRARILHR